MLNRARPSCFWGVPSCVEATRRKRETGGKATCIAAKAQRNNCRGTCQICSAASGASFNGLSRLSRQDTVPVTLRPCVPRRRMPHASGQQGSPTPALWCHNQGKPRAYLLVGGGDWRELGEWDEEACGWLQVRILIDRGRCERKGSLDRARRARAAWMTTSALCNAQSRRFCVLLHTPLTRKQSKSVAQSQAPHPSISPFLFL